ncbi:MAG: DUF1415 domain-containing protein [Gammaproteobacteria bacterium]|nr:DUF1415 domain-containing protein [Gammaproteobacteria bacterium]MCW8988343.1 DUF1415 domain-containing protein [Gammaproteobacteria bacterium]MCW9030206.1 DUF1415 domain-containing protein [Gammaproteobacteria bacterium]
MPNQNNGDQRVIAQTKKWVESVIVAHNYCPFARREVEKGSIRYQVVHETEFNSLLKAVIQECVWLDQHAGTETTLIIFPENLNEFNLFLDCLALAEDLLVAQGYEATYQIASFHPDYCFQGADENDAANYTNRSPYPMFHLIREASVEVALKHHPDPESIPERNVEFAREQGLEKMQSLLHECYSVEND